MSDLHNKLKTEMEQREIAPQPSAWDRLEFQLNEEVKSEKKSPFSWTAIAASILLIAGIAAVMFFNNLTVTPENTVANQPIENVPVQGEIPSVIIPESPNSEITASEIFIPKDDYSSNHGSEKRLASSVKKQEINKVEIERTSLENNIPQEIVIAVVPETVPEADKELKKELPSSDELLRHAMQKRQIKRETAIAVDSKRMLNDVEDELYEAKSPDILEKLTGRIKSLQVAFVNRNKE